MPRIRGACYLALHRKGLASTGAFLPLTCALLGFVWRLLRSAAVVRARAVASSSFAGLCILLSLHLRCIPQQQQARSIAAASAPLCDLWRAAALASCAVLRSVALCLPRADAV
jgi:hypothetical protein